MARARRIWIVVCFLFLELLTGSQSSRVRRQAPEDSQDPSLQDLGSLLGQLPSRTLTGNGMDLTSLMDSLTQGAQAGTGMGQGGVDLSSVMEMAEAFQHDPQAGRSLAGQSEDGMMQVYLETKSLDDLLASEGGRRQLGQLNAQLEQALDSLDDGVHVMQAQQGLNGLEGTLEDLARLLAGGGGGLAGNETAAMLTQLLQAMDQLPALKGLVESLYRMLAGLEGSSQPSPAHSMQQLLALASSSLLGSGGSVQGADSVRQMLDMALSSLTDNAQLINTMLYNTQLLMADPALLYAANHTRCLLTSLTSPQPDHGLALQCMQLLLQSAVTQHNSEQILGSLNDFLNTVLNDPAALHSLMALLQTPSLDSALAVVQSLVGQLDVADLDLTTAMQTVQSMLSGLTQNPQLLEALTDILQGADSGQLYDQLVGMLHNATQAAPLTQQLVLVVNDTLVSLWTSGDLRQAADTLRHVTAMLTAAQDPDQPWSPAQRAFLDLLYRLTDMIVHLTTPTPPPTPTTPKPAVTYTTTTVAPTTTTTDMVKETTPALERTTSPATTTTTTARPATSPPTTLAPVATTPTPAPATTRRDTVDDEGDNSGTHISCSVLSLLLALLLSGWLS